MEQTGSFSFWLSAVVGGLIVLLQKYLTDSKGWLPGTVYLACLVATVPAVIVLCLVFKLPITPDAVTNHATLALTAFGITRAFADHQAEKAARTNGNSN